MTHLLSASLHKSRQLLLATPILFDHDSNIQTSQEIIDQLLKFLLEKHLHVVLILCSLYKLRNESEWQRYIAAIKSALDQKTFTATPTLPPLPNVEVY